MSDTEEEALREFQRFMQNLEKLSDAQLAAVEECIALERRRRALAYWLRPHEDVHYTPGRDNKAVCGVAAQKGSMTRDLLTCAECLRLTAPGTGL